MIISESLSISTCVDRPALRIVHHRIAIIICDHPIITCGITGTGTPFRPYLLMTKAESMPKLMPQDSLKITPAIGRRECTICD